MPKRSKTAANAADMEAFGRRLVALLDASGQARHGAGRYLADRYKVSTVTANAWLNGAHRAEPGVARRIAEDHGSTFDELYFGRIPEASTHAREAQATYQAEALRLDADEHALLMKYRATDDAGRNILKRVAGALPPDAASQASLAD